MNWTRSLLPASLLLFLTLQSCVAVENSTFPISPNETTKGEASSNIDEVAKEIQNAFKFLILQKETTTTQSRITESALNASATTDFIGENELTTNYDGFITVFETTESEKGDDVTTPLTTSTTSSSVTQPQEDVINTTIKKPASPFKFTILTSPTSPKSTTTAPPSRQPTESDSEPTTVARESEDITSNPGFFTIFETTEKLDVEETTVIDTTTTTRRTTPKTRRPTTTTSRRPIFISRITTTATKRTPKPTTVEIKNGDSVHEFKNSGIQFIIKSTVSTPKTRPFVTPKSTVASSRTKSKTSTNSPKTKSIDREEDLEFEDYFYTTQESNGSAIVIGGIGGHVPGLPVEGVAVHYFPDPAIFWAKYWYWILVVLLLIILLFLIPGFLCQVYLSKWCRRRKMDRFFEKNPRPLFHFERMGFGFCKSTTPTPDEESGESDSFESSSGVASEMKDSEDRGPSSHPSVASVRYPASSLPEADIHQQQNSDETKPMESVKSGSENATVIIIPDPMSESNPRSYNASDNIPHRTSIEFPEPGNLTPPAIPERATSLRSQSDIGLDIGNETIIKSNNITKPSPVAPVPAFRPPKPDYLIPRSQPPEVAPSSRPKQPPKRPPKRRPEPAKHRSSLQNKRASPTKSDPVRPSARKEKARKTREKKPEKKQPPKKKTQSSTQSIIEAAKSLEDILEAITKLTREYPIPDLPEGEKKTSKKKQPREPKDSRREKRRKAERKPRQEERTRPSEREKWRYPDEEMQRRKEKRTKNWADEQRKIEKSKDKRRKKGDKKSSRKDQDPSRQKRRKREESAPSKSEDKTDDKDNTEEPKKKIPTLIKEKVPEPDKTKQERRRMRLERDLKKLQRYHNKAAKNSGEAAGES